MVTALASGVVFVRAEVHACICECGGLSIGWMALGASSTRPSDRPAHVENDDGRHLKPECGLVLGVRPVRAGLGCWKNVVSKGVGRAREWEGKWWGAYWVSIE